MPEPQSAILPDLAKAPYSVMSELILLERSLARPGRQWRGSLSSTFLRTIVESARIMVEVNQ